MALIKHMKRCRSEDRFECEQCDQIFSTSEKLQKHVATEHVFEEEGRFLKNQKDKANPQYRLNYWHTSSNVRN